MFCNKCGNEIIDGDLFCQKCGESVGADNSACESQTYINYNEQSDSITRNLNYQVYKGNSRGWNTMMLVSLLVIVFLMILLLISLRKNNISQVLVVEINGEESESYSDEIQIRRALKNGGMIILNNVNMDDDEFKMKIQDYGADDSKGNYWVLGAILNYIANEGWELVHAPSSGLSNTYYFVR